VIVQVRAFRDVTSRSLAEVCMVLTMQFDVWSVQLRVPA
jgi:hypothetical protein